VTGSIGISLGITAIGMTLLFLALAFFYGLLSLMTSVMQDRRLPPEPQAAGRRKAAQGLQAAKELESDRAAAEAGPGLVRRRAAAIAVALARAEAAATGPAPRPPAPQEAGPASAWWALHHQRRLQPGTRRQR
jgi:hypothetical protein